jgi:pseudaminic acid synthase
VTASIIIGDRAVGAGSPTYVIAELSANHGQRFDDAVRLVESARDAGADAVKLQTYTPDTITLDTDKESFRLKGTAWDGRTLHSLYKEAYTPWEWHGRLKEIANGLGLDLFSSPFDPTAVDFLAELGVPAFKIASCELIDLPLIARAARTGKPLVMSTGMATLGEIEEAVRAAVEAGGREIALLKCTAAYPAPPEDMNLRTIPHLAAAFGVPVGLSDHTLGVAVPAAAVALGACIVEKHLTLARATPGPDSAFSLEPHEFKAMVDAVRTAERALGSVTYGPRGEEVALRRYRRSLFVCEDVKAGEVFTERNVRSVRPADGLHTRHYEEILGRRASRDVERGTPLDWSLID